MAEQQLPCIRIGHLRVVDHLIIGMSNSRLTSDSADLKHLNFESVCLNSWAQVCDGLITGNLNGAFITLPMAMALFSQGLDLKLIMLTHRSGSLLVTNTRAEINNIASLRNKSILVPAKLSVQHMLLHHLLSNAGLELGGMEEPQAQVIREDINPSVMPEMLAMDKDNDIGGFIAPDPFATAAIGRGDAQKFCATDSLWQNHPCCGFVLHQSCIDNYPEATDELTMHFMESATYLTKVTSQDVLDCAADFLSQERDIAKISLIESKVNFTPSSLIPDIDMLVRIQSYMADTMGILTPILDLNTFLDEDRIANISERFIEN